MKSSWVEQRQWGIDFPLEALGADSALHKRILDEFKKMLPHPRELKHPERVTIGSMLRVGGWAELRIGSNAAIVEFRDIRTGVTWASAASPLALIRYQTLVLDDFNKWHAEYIINATNTSASGSDEYGKPASMMDAVPTPQHQLEAPVAESVWTGTDGCTVVVEARFKTELHLIYGAPQTVRTELDLCTTGKLSVAVQLLNKTATR